jgi:hypothetical protein
LLRILAVFWEQYDADAGRDLVSPAVGMDNHLLDMVLDLRGHVNSLFAGRLRQNDCEFVTAEPAKNGLILRAFGKPVGDLSQQSVAHLVTADVVDVFKLV